MRSEESLVGVAAGLGRIEVAVHLRPILVDKVGIARQDRDVFAGLLVLADGGATVLSQAAEDQVRVFGLLQTNFDLVVLEELLLGVDDVVVARVRKHHVRKLVTQELGSHQGGPLGDDGFETLAAESGVPWRTVLPLFAKRFACPPLELSFDRVLVLAFAQIEVTLEGRPVDRVPARRRVDWVLGSERRVAVVIVAQLQRTALFLRLPIVLLGSLLLCDSGLVVRSTTERLVHLVV